MDFPLLTEAKVIITKYLHHLGLKLVNTSTQDVLRSYFNLKNKIISQQPREVIFSSGLMSKAVELNLDSVLEVIAQKFANGDDVNPFLSKGIFRLEDHDYLLNDWGIHHLHLNVNTNKSDEYFNQRSNQLLFVHVTDEKAYLIDIRPHQEEYVFAQRDLLRVVRDNWPDLNVKFLVRDDEMEVFPKLDESDIVLMRRRGYMFFTQVDKHAYMPGLGSACSGFSVKAGLEMDEFCRHLYKVHCYVLEHQEELKEKLSTQLGKPLSNIGIKLAFRDWKFYFFEVFSQQLVNIDVSNYQPPYPDEP